MKQVFLFILSKCHHFFCVMLFVHHHTDFFVPQIIITPKLDQFMDLIDKAPEESNNK